LFQLIPQDREWLRYLDDSEMRAAWLHAGNVKPGLNPSQTPPQYFDGHVSAELLILRSKDLTHAAFAKLTCDLVMPSVLPIMRKPPRRQPVQCKKSG